MVNRIKYLILCILLLSFVSCAAKIEPIKIPKSNFIKTEAIKQEPLPKPDKPEMILLDELFMKTTDKSKAKYFAFPPTEFAKIVALSSSFSAQSEMFKESINLVNLKIEEINTLKELIASKELLAEHLALLYANEQAMRQFEAHEYKVQKLMDRMFMLIQSGVIVALAVVAL